MKAKSSWIVIVCLAVAVGCTRAPNDAQIANQVQGKIAADTNVQNKQIGVESANGVVTLSGNVGSELERNAAGNDAAQVAGVKTVVNNLQVSPETATQQAPAAAEQPAPGISRRRAPAENTRPRARERAATSAPSAQGEAIASTAAASAPRTVTVPEGTVIAVRLIDPIDTERSKAGDTFRATLSQPVMVGDEVVIPGDADITGQIVDSKSAGHFTGQSALALTLTSLRVNGKTYQLRTSQYEQQGSSRGKRTAATVGGGAGLGAIIGGIAGGGKGAAIGAAVGAGAGTGVQAATKGQQIKLPSETVLNFRLENPVNVVPSSTTQRNADRQRVDE